MPNGVLTGDGQLNVCTSYRNRCTTVEREGATHATQLTTETRGFVGERGFSARPIEGNSVTLDHYPAMSRCFWDCWWLLLVQFSIFHDLADVVPVSAMRMLRVGLEHNEAELLLLFRHRDNGKSLPLIPNYYLDIHPVTGPANSHAKFTTMLPKIGNEGKIGYQLIISFDLYTATLLLAGFV